MMMNTVSNLNSNAGRTFKIEVVGSPRQAALRTSAYTLQVPYSNLSQTIHSIGKRGGKVVNVQSLSIPLAASAPVVAATEVINTSEDSDTGDLRRQSSRSKKR